MAYGGDAGNDIQRSADQHPKRLLGVILQSARSESIKQRFDDQPGADVQQPSRAFGLDRDGLVESRSDIFGDAERN